MVALIVVLLFVGAPVKPMRFIAHGTVKLGIGILFLFFFNVFAGAIGLHILFNLFIVAVSVFLGLFWVGSLASIIVVLFIYSWKVPTHFMCTFIAFYSCT